MARASGMRRQLLQQLVFNLALVLGLAQAAVVHWGIVIAGGDPVPGVGFTLLAATLVFGNALAVPRITGARRRRDNLGIALRGYVHLGIATLLVGIAIAASWTIFLPTRLALGFEPALEAFRVTSPLLVVLVASAVGWGFTWGQSRVARTRVPVEIDGLHDVLGGLRLVQISDLHIGNGLEGARLERMVERVNAAEPDVIVLTGDIFDFDPAVLEHGSRRLGALRARHGVYAILGNHDAYVGSDRVADALARHAPRLRLLRDEIVRLPVAAPLYLAGLEDRSKSWFDRDLRHPTLDALAARRPDDGPVLLLAHNPEVFGHAAELGFPLVLAGHTHGGQLALPTRRGRWNLARVMTPLSRGLYRSASSTLYVNRGLGVGGPALRINCTREIATIELRVRAGASEALLEHVDHPGAPEPRLLVGS